MNMTGKEEHLMAEDKLADSAPLGRDPDDP